jgi:hypothetical protein
MMLDTNRIVGSFARHETFHPRYGWLRKSYQAARLGPETFSRADATVELGVGKNMVNAIRYWGAAFDLLDEVRLPGRGRTASFVPSALADAVFDEAGWDPYLEDPGSLWLLHWRLLRPRCVVPVWWLAFHGFEPAQFTEEQLLHVVEEHVDNAPEWTRIAPGSIKKDVDCVLRMYAPPRARGRDAFEDVLDCPFRELGLIEPEPGEVRAYRWVYGPKPTLPPEIVAHAAVDFAQTETGGSTVSLTSLATAVGGPGRAFKLPEGALYEALSAASQHVREIEVTSPAGIRQLAVLTDDERLPVRILEAYYKRTAGSRRRVSDRSVSDVVREYDSVVKDLARESDRLRELELRQRRIVLTKELDAAGIAV